jgi:hypothetical protein
MSIKLKVIVLLCLLMAIPSIAVSKWNLFHVSANGRYILSPDGNPFLITACTAWTLPTDYSLDEVCAYLDIRKRQGFNAIQMSAVFSEIDKERCKQAFANDDILQPIDSYWQKVDRCVEEATQRGLVVIINPLWKRSVNEFIKRQGTEKCRRFGKWFGKRYRHNPRVLYFIGGDQIPEPIRSEMDAMGQGLQDAYKGKALVAYHSEGSQSSREAFPQASWLTFNWTYAYTPSYKFEGKPRHPYAMNYDNYNYQPIMPIQMGEGYYDFGPVKQYGKDGTSGRWGNRYALRRQAWWNLLSGACGVAYGAEGIWHKNRDGQTWQKCVDYPSGKDFVLMRRYMENYKWWTLHPDTAHSVLRDGYGTFGTDDYALAAVSADGNTIIVYTPVAHKLVLCLPNAHVTPKILWIDPTENHTIEAMGMRQGTTFSLVTPGNNAAGESDWLLVVKLN